MEKIATDIATFEKVIGEANGTDEPVMARTAVVRTAVARTAAAFGCLTPFGCFSAAGAGQGDGHVTTPAAPRLEAPSGCFAGGYETAAVRNRAVRSKK